MTRVHVVDRAAFFGGDWPQGFFPVAPDAADEFLGRAQRAGRFVERALAEATPAWKQWIPYCVVRCLTGDNPAEDQDFGVFVVQRTRAQSEARLHGSWSIGIGGHIEPIDGETANPAIGSGGFFAAALARELDEELHFRQPRRSEPRLVGLINDDSTEVGQVHAGLAYVLDLALPRQAAEAAVGIREISKMRGGFAHLAELRKLWHDPDRFESWSRFLVDAGIAGPMGETSPPDPVPRVL